jgi:hypothetical protein
MGQAQKPSHSEWCGVPYELLSELSAAPESCCDGSVLGSVFGSSRGSEYPGKFSSDFLQSLQPNAGMVTRLGHSHIFSIHYSPITLPFDAVSLKCDSVIKSTTEKTTETTSFRLFRPRKYFPERAISPLFYYLLETLQNRDRELILDIAIDRAWSYDCLFRQAN